MGLQEELREVFAGYPAQFSEKKGVVTVEWEIASRKAFLSQKKLVYRAKYRIDEACREVRFTEMLKESGFGVSGFGGFESGAGFGFKKTTYKTGGSGTEGSIAEQSSLFGKKYSYAFNFQTIRASVEQKAREAGFAFKYRITSIGL